MTLERAQRARFFYANVPDDISTALGIAQEAGAPASLQTTLYEWWQNEIAEAEARGRAAGLEEMAQWHEKQRPRLSGPDYGMSSENERRAIRELDALHANCAAVARALADPSPAVPNAS